tara:strand:- start:14 stop:379 length:366 start_codon:yes stop_codon:yes gene_type:complete
MENLTACPFEADPPSTIVIKIPSLIPLPVFDVLIDEETSSLKASGVLVGLPVLIVNQALEIVCPVSTVHVEHHARLRVDLTSFVGHQREQVTMATLAYLHVALEEAAPARRVVQRPESPAG